MPDQKSILIFGVGELQKSVICRAKAMGLYVVGIDPCADAAGKDCTDAFEIVGGQDREGTLAIAQKYKISALATAATDKPLVMMARLAENLGLPFYSVKTAEISTDKFLMKECFEKDGIPCARGRLISTAEQTADLCFPLIVKPRDNSGSRGVVLCQNRNELAQAIQGALEFSRKDTVLVEEFIEGQEYSIEALHYEGNAEVIQFTEKTTTPFPYNVELAHVQPATLDEHTREKIRELVGKIGKAMGFTACASHTELKINSRGIFIIETSPRLGGDYITSTLTPLSTGINIEDQLLHIALGEKPDSLSGRQEQASGVTFLQLPEGQIRQIHITAEEVRSWPGVVSFCMKLHEGDLVKAITSSLDRYGELIVVGQTPEEVHARMDTYTERIYKLIEIA